jgi:predicted HD superfamily hydrolase involved in NAD metabolism
MTPDLEGSKELLRTIISPRTLAHSLAVVETAGTLSKAFGADPESARLAALLHDCAKDLPMERYVPLARGAGLELFDEELLSPRVLHQRLGALWAAERFGVHDEAVLAAICCHTTGQAEMDSLARCLMVADYISPDRSFDGVDDLRTAAQEDTEAGFLAVLSFKRDMVRAKGLPEHPWARAAYERWDS